MLTALFFALFYSDVCRTIWHIYSNICYFTLLTKCTIFDLLFHFLKINIRK